MKAFANIKSRYAEYKALDSAPVTLCRPLSGMNLLFLQYNL